MNTKNIQKKTIHKKIKKEEMSYSKEFHLVKNELFGVGITSATKENILEFIIKSIEKKEKPYYIVTPNPEMIVLASKNLEFRKVLNNARIASNDGVGLAIAGQILGNPLTERTTGVDLMENLCKRVADWPITVGFLGGGPGVAEMASECLKQKYPGLKVSFAREETNQQEKIPATDILFVALGAPKQEFWMSEHLGKIPVRVMMGVGGAFDYISGKVPRAPRLVRSFGFEWLFRLFIQPWRWRRQLALIAFMWMVVKEKLRK